MKIRTPELPEYVTLRLEQGAIATLFVGGLVFAGLGLTEKPRPEVIIETCSFAAALLLVAAEHRRSRRTRRHAAIANIAHEMQRNARALYSDDWLLDTEAVAQQLADPRRGLRFYYPHLATVSTGGALLGDALDPRHDRGLIAQLQLWQQSAEAFNTRATMAEFLLFFLPRREESMLERLEIHVTIATETARAQRDELAAVAATFQTLEADRHLSRKLVEPIGTIRKLLEQRIAVETSADALRAYLADVLPDAW